MWNHYEWIEETYNEGRLRGAILDNVQRTLLCKTLYLGYDAFDRSQCDNWIWLFRHCHSRFCSSCGIKYQKRLAAKAEVPVSTLEKLKNLPPVSEEYKIMCPFCLNDMYEADSDRFIKK